MLKYKLMHTPLTGFYLTPEILLLLAGFILTLGLVKKHRYIKDICWFTLVYTVSNH